MRTGSQIIYTDTDSIVVYIYTEDFYSDIEKIKNKFDTSDIDCNKCEDCHKKRIHSKQNTKVVGLMKDETAGNPITEFCAISPKQYAFVVYDPCTNKEKQGKKCKGVNKKTVADEFEIELYKNVLDTSKLYNTSFKKMQHKNHEVSIVTINKIGLSPLDTKRYYIDNIYSRPFGHWRN